MHIIEGGCHCGNIAYRAELPEALSTYVPRACDCRLCTSHGAAYVSDRAGALAISINVEGDVSRYRQGSRIADFLICRKCGVLVAVCYEDGGRRYGSINVRSAPMSDFGEIQTVTLTHMTDEERIRRWKTLWFADVRIQCGQV